MTTPAQYQTRKFTVEEYHRMAEVGILGPDERLELINGEIVVLPSITPAEAAAMDNFRDAVATAHGAPLREAFLLRNSSPIQLEDGSQPHPDIALLRRRPGGYAAAHPTPADVLLIIEVADTEALEIHRRARAQQYGRAGVPETWIENIPQDCIERFTQPGPDGYATHTIHRHGETLTPELLPDEHWPVDEMLHTLFAEE